jgi:hypothetical protein
MIYIIIDNFPLKSICNRKINFKEVVLKVIQECDFYHIKLTLKE